MKYESAEGDGSLVLVTTAGAARVVDRRGEYVL